MSYSLTSRVFYAINVHMAERILEQLRAELTPSQMAHKGADLFIAASMNVPSSPACQGAYIALECQRGGLDPRTVGLRLSMNNEAQNRIITAANRVHARHRHVLDKLEAIYGHPEVTRSSAQVFIDAAYEFAEMLVDVPEKDLQALVDKHPGKGMTSMETEKMLQQEAYQNAKRARMKKLMTY